MSLTLDDVVGMFERYCDESGKLFVPEPRQTGVIENLIKHYEKYYDEEILEETIRYFIKNSYDDAILVFNFALQSGKIRDRAIDERKDRQEIERLMGETKERMSRYNNEL